MIHLSDSLAWNANLGSTVGLKAPVLDHEVYEQVQLEPERVEELVPTVLEDFSSTDLPF